MRFINNYIEKDTKLDVCNKECSLVRDFSKLFIISN
jgi:hypothetical protein